MLNAYEVRIPDTDCVTVRYTKGKENDVRKTIRKKDSEFSRLSKESGKRLEVRLLETFESALVDEKYDYYTGYYLQKQKDGECRFFTAPRPSKGMAGSIEEHKAKATAYQTEEYREERKKEQTELMEDMSRRRAISEAQLENYHIEHPEWKERNRVQMKEIRAKKKW